jgi:hypothetical protein
LMDDDVRRVPGTRDKMHKGIIRFVETFKGAATGKS